MRRGILVGGALAALLGAAAGRGAPPGSRGAARPLVAALGPLRPLMAELLYVSFLEGWLHRDPFGQVDLAHRILALRPDVPLLWADLCYHFLLDVPGEEWRLEEEQAWVRAGVRLLEDGLRRFPDSPELLLVRGNIVEVFARAHPDRLELLGLESGRDALPLVLECYEAALRAAQPGTEACDLARLHLGLVVEALLRQEALPPELRARAEGNARWLLELPETTPETRRRLDELLRR